MGERLYIVNGCLMALLLFAMGTRAKDLIRLTWSCVQDMTNEIDGTPTIVVHQNGTKNRMEEGVKHKKIFDLLTHTNGGPLCIRGGDLTGKERSIRYITEDPKRFDYQTYMGFPRIECTDDSCYADGPVSYMCVACVLRLYLNLVGGKRPDGDVHLLATCNRLLFYTQPGRAIV